jgi:hypothetical protein
MQGNQIRVQTKCDDVVWIVFRVKFKSRSICWRPLIHSRKPLLLQLKEAPEKNKVSLTGKSGRGKRGKIALI